MESESADKEIAVVDSIVMGGLKDTLMGGEISAPKDQETAVELGQDIQKNRKRKKARVLDSEGIRRRNLAQQQRVKEQRKAADELRAEVSKALTRRGHPAGKYKEYEQNCYHEACCRPSFRGESP